MTRRAIDSREASVDFTVLDEVQTEMLDRLEGTEREEYLRNCLGLVAIEVEAPDSEMAIEEYATQKI